MSQGTIKRLVTDKGFGFITPDDKSELPAGKEDLFFHATAVIGGARIESLQEGQRVSYTLGDGPKGPQATDVSGM
ncbi:MAG: cold shock domain-containing protein [Candidatus Pacebacteria bacterium]|nr:cold shock domain-containing protein [Candidatus Paceibacterota bacterium]